MNKLMHAAECDQADLGRRDFLAAAGGTAVIALSSTAALAAADSTKPLNLAIVATPSASYVSADTRLTSLNSGATPVSSADPAQLAFGTAPEKGTQWAQYEWNEPVSTNAIDVYWWGKHWGIALPVASRLLYWDGAQFVPVKNARGFGLEPNAFNRTEFDTVTTQRLRLEIDAAADKSIGSPAMACVERRRRADVRARGDGRRGPYRHARRADLSTAAALRGSIASPVTPRAGARFRGRAR